MDFFVFIDIIRPNTAVFQQLQILTDNAGDNPKRNAALLIDAGDDKTDVIFLAGAPSVITGMGNGVDAVG